MITTHCPKCQSRMMRDYVQRPGPSSTPRPYMKKGWWCPKCDYALAESDAVSAIKAFANPVEAESAKAVPVKAPRKSKRKTSGKKT